MCCKVADLEAHGGHGPSDLLKDELTQSLEELEALLKAKDEVGTFQKWGTPHQRSCGDRGVRLIRDLSPISGNSHLAK